MNQSCYQLYFIRHGRSLGNELSLLAGWTDVPLSEAGIAELALLKESISYPQVDLYYSSDLSRARDTICAIYPQAKSQLTLDHRFREAYFGVMENSVLNAEDEQEYFRRYYMNQLSPCFGENYEDGCIRIRAACIDLLDSMRAHKHSSAAIGCHYGTIKCLLHIWTSCDAEEKYIKHIPNGSCTRFSFTYSAELNEWALNDYEYLGMNEC